MEEKEISLGNKLKRKKYFLILFLVFLITIILIFIVFKNKPIEKLNENNIILKDSYTINENIIESLSISINKDKSYVFSPKENPLFGFTRSLVENEEVNVDINLYKFNDSLEYLNFITSSSEKLDSSKLNKIKSYNVKMQQGVENQRVAYFEIPEKLEVGFYLMTYKVDTDDVRAFDEYGTEEIKNDETFQPFIVSNLSSYVSNTERDTLVWVYNNETKKPVENVRVNYNNSIFKTDKEGKVIFENVINHNEDRVEFVDIKDGNDEILVAIENFNVDNYYTGYVYSDKPIYKNSDTIKLWGYVPTNLFIDEIDYNLFKVKIGEEFISVNPSKDGIFMADYVLNDVDNGDYNIELYYNDKSISEIKTIKVYDYSKDEIEYNIETDKNNYMFNDTVNVKLSATKLTGEKVANQKLILGPSITDKSCYTNNDGYCIVSVKLDDHIIRSPYDSLEDVFLGVYTEESQKKYETVTSKNITVVYNDIDLIVEKKIQSDNLFYYDVKLQKISIENDKLVYNDTSGIVTVKTTKTNCKRSAIAKAIYNGTCDLEENREELVKTYNVDGNYTIKDINYIASVRAYDTYSESIEYDRLEFTINDNYNHTRRECIDIPIVNADNYYLVEDVSNSLLSKFSLFSTIRRYYYPILIYHNTKTSSIYGNFGDARTEYYAKYLKFDYYSVNDKIDLTLKKNGATTIEKKNQLTYFFKEKILDTYMNKKNTTFKDNYFPGVNIGGAYYNESDSKMYLAKYNYLDYKHTDRNVKITMNLDKETYEPNESVTLKIKVTDKSGKGVKTDMLVSVVDEAIFLSKEDTNDRIVSIYNNKYFPFYQYSTYQPLPFTPAGGGASGGEYGNLKNGDTIYFKNIKTDGNGNAAVTFKTNNNETKFRITAISANTDLYYGTNVIKFVSKKDDVVKKQEVVDLKFTNTSLKVDKGSSTLITSITNQTNNDIEVKKFNIYVKDKNGNEIVKLEGYIGGIIAAGESRETTSIVDMDLSNAANIEYEIEK